MWHETLSFSFDYVQLRFILSASIYYIKIWQTHISIHDIFIFQSKISVYNNFKMLLYMISFDCLSFTLVPSVIRLDSMLIHHLQSIFGKNMEIMILKDLHSRTLPSCCVPLYIMLNIHLTELLSRFSLVKLNNTLLCNTIFQYTSHSNGRNTIKNKMLFLLSLYRDYVQTIGFLITGKKKIKSKLKTGAEQEYFSHHFHNFPKKLDGTRLQKQNTFLFVKHL